MADRGWGQSNSRVYNPETGGYTEAPEYDINGNIIGAVPGVAALPPGSTQEQIQVSDIPQLQDFKSILNADGTLKDEYKYTPEDFTAKEYEAQNYDAKILDMDDEKFQLDNTAYDELNKVGLGQKDSAWYGAAKDAQGIANLDLLERTKQEAASQAASAQANMAMTGGLRGGARERLATQGMEQGLLASQGARRQGNLANLGLDVQHGQQQMDILKSLPGMDVNRKNYTSGLEQFNIGQQNQAGMFNTNSANQAGMFNTGEANRAGMYNAGEADSAAMNDIRNLMSGVGDVNRRGEYEYTTDMTAYGANKTADALAKQPDKKWYDPLLNPMGQR